MKMLAVRARNQKKIRFVINIALRYTLRDNEAVL